MFSRQGKMPRIAKKRQADEIMRASFSIPYAKWKQFQHIVRAKGNTVSATLVTLIEDYLIAQQTYLSPEDNSDNPTNVVKETAELETQFDCLKEQLNQLQGKIKELETSLDKNIEVAVATQFDNLEYKLHKLQTTVKELDRRQSKFENQANQIPSYPHSESTLIDIEAIPVKEEEINNGNNKESESSYLYTQENLFEEIFDVLDDVKYQEKSINVNVNNQGITEQALCQRFGLKPSRIVRNAKLRGLSSPEYLYQVTGWFYHNGKYYASVRE